MGRRTLDFFDFIGGITKLFIETIYWIFIPPIKKERTFEQAKIIPTFPVY